MSLFSALFADSLRKQQSGVSMEIFSLSNN